MIKIKQIESICKKRKTVIMTEAAGSQWIGDGKAFYPISGLPELTRENVFTIFDVPVDKREGFYFSEVETLPYCFDDYDVAERLVSKGDLYLIFDGMTACPFKTSQGLYLIDAKYLRPFYGTEDGFDIYERISATGETYFAVKAGFLLLGLILPISVEWAQLIHSLEGLRTFAEMSLTNELTAKKAEAYQAGLLDKEDINGTET